MEQPSQQGPVFHMENPRHPVCEKEGHQEAESLIGPWAAHVFCWRCRLVIRPFNEEDWKALEGP